MSNRNFYIMTAVVFLGMLTLFALNLTEVLTTQSDDPQTYLKYNDVRGMAVGHNQLLYTLNFKQQNTVVDILNRAVRVVGVKPGKRQKPNIDQIIVYQFDNKPDITITPIAYVDSNLVFTAPEWNGDGYLMEISNGSLQQLLSQTFDP